MINKIKYILQQSWQKILLVWQHKKIIILNFLRRLWIYVKRIFLWLDQGINVVFLAGYEDESMSSRFYRWSKKEGKLWKIPALVVNTLFFFDYKIVNGHKQLHCEKAHYKEIARTGLPHSMRKCLKKQ